MLVSKLGLPLLYFGGETVYDMSVTIIVMIIITTVILNE